MNGTNETYYTWFTDPSGGTNPGDDMPMDSTNDSSVVAVNASFFAKRSDSNTLNCTDNDGDDYNINAVDVMYEHDATAVGPADTITVTWYFDLKEFEFWAMVGLIWWECDGL